MEGGHNELLSMGFADTEKDLIHFLSTFVVPEDEINNLFTSKFRFHGRYSFKLLNRTKWLRNCHAQYIKY